ncbi:SWIM zinc finger family protein [Pseudobdellovibrio exovorus]|uniref:SWIM-type domain-containing protein n=1 Tax=Pseudobdellovibrio exovorus JSS TaxID=1184267 RepID=M4V9D9_9BACT|nr:SWIM zinc finger family protein [Pseudobdellovibrio exovorus]AGH94641.1 hypothetical protein A11Q_421 [Pseudobdellovibrio exovorus JSS]
MSTENWEHFFKPEVRSSGRALFTQGKTSLSQPSDTEVVAFMRTTPPFKVSLKSNAVSSPTLFVDCNCPAGKKDLFCKHIWATLLATEGKNPDFFESKLEIEKMTSASHVKAKPTAQSQAWEEKKAALKEKQSLLRKIQYQKQKLRLKEMKHSKKSIPNEPSFPKDVENSLVYFSQNGFELRTELTQELVSAAKKKLSLVFHPDRNGSHVEIIELNKHADVLMRYVKKITATDEA